MSGTTVRTRGDDSFALQLSGPAGATLHGVALETTDQQAPAVVLWQGAQLNAQGLVVPGQQGRRFRDTCAGCRQLHVVGFGYYRPSQEVAGIYVQEGMRGR